MVFKFITLAISVIYTYWKNQKFLEKRTDENKHQKYIRWLFNILLFCFCCAITYSVMFFLYYMYKYVEYKGLIPPSLLDLLIYFWNNF